MADPPRLTEAKVRAILEDTLRVVEDPATWRTRHVEFHLDSGAVVAGELQYLEPASAIIDGPRGLRSVVLANVRGVLNTYVSPGPE